MERYTCSKFEELQKIYSILRKKNHKLKINVEFNDNTKKYTIYQSNEPFEGDPEVPIDLDIKVIYGDSVTGDTPLLLRNPETNYVHIETISSIFDETKKVEYPGFKIFDKSIRLEKEYSTTNYQIWTDIGWVNINRVIRHRCDKKIYRVLTHTGCVDVTEDHSLLTRDLQPIKPTELKIGTELSHTFPTKFNETKETIVKMKKNIEKTKICNTCKIEKCITEYYKNNKLKDGRSNKCRDCEYYINSTKKLRNIYKNFKLEDYSLTEKEAEVWGFFQGDGSCGSYDCNSGIKNSWALNNNDLKRLKYFKDILESIEPIKFEILDTLVSSGVYKLVPKGSIKYMIDKYRKLFYYEIDCNSEGDKYKIVPNIILNASKEIKMAYWRGYWEADGTKTSGFNVTKPSFAVKGKIGAHSMYYLMRSLGYNMGLQLDNHPKKLEMYRLTFTNFKIKKEFSIKKIIHKGVTNNYVYDIETEIGRFGVGVGQLQVLNTDSIMMRFKYNRDDYTKNREDTFRLGNLCGELFTNEVVNRNPIELEFEKIFQPFILLTKKRYIANKYEDTKNPMKLAGNDIKGVALTRRDYCLMVKKCYQEVIDCLLDYTDTNDIEENVNKSIKLFKTTIQKIDKYEIEIDNLIISGKLAKSYKSKPAHALLADKLKERNEEVQIGDRIQYIFIENTTDDKLKKTELAEDPVYAKEHKLYYNRAAYLEQLAKPILGIYKVILQNDSELLDKLIDYVNFYLVDKYNNKKLNKSDFTIKDE
jgi:hypothetical protein